MLYVQLTHMMLNNYLFSVSYFHNDIHDYINVWSYWTNNEELFDPLYSIALLSTCSFPGKIIGPGYFNICWDDMTRKQMFKLCVLYFFK